MRSSPIRSSRAGGSAGFTLLEMMVAIAVLSVVMLLTLATFTQSSLASKVVVARADLSQKAAAALEQIADDLRSTQPGQISTTASTISLFKVQSVSASGATFTATRARYELDTSTPGHANRRLRYSPPLANQRPAFLVGEVEAFTVTPTANSFPVATPVTFELTITLKRERVLPADAGNPDGSIRVTSRTRVTVPRGN